MVLKMTKPTLSKPISKKEWEQLELYYLEKINTIHIPEDPKPSDLLSINAKLEQLYHEARLDIYYAKRSFEHIESAYRKLKRALFPLVKTGKNTEERDHLLQNYLMSTKLDQIEEHILQSLGLPKVPATIYSIYDVYKERVDFLQTVLDLIADKTARLITDSGAMKIETKFSN